ncbi:type II secretion system protein N [Teredinibacter turnerae]|uniref:type II secretion system protein N n=1 Tax=Teredinibacter turnerae TaxID=2426 RepID=UPI000369949E|nr:type II secretion system protein N [Teredinibacter turnerae]
MTVSSTLLKPLIYLFFIGYFLYLVLSRAPAELAASAVHAAVPNVWLTGVEGSLWHGRAASGQLDLPQSAIPLGNVTWDLDPLSLILLSPCVKLNAVRPGLQLDGTVCHSITGSSRIKDLMLETSVDPVNELIAVQISGQASINVLSAEIKNMQVEALDARASWLNGSVYTGESWLAVGSYGANLNGLGNGEVSAKLFDIDAPVTVDMGATWNMQQGWKTQGTVKPAPLAPDLIKGAVQLVGEELEPGVYRVMWP